MAKTTKTSGPFTAAIMSKLGMITMDTRNIPAPHIVFEHLFKTGLSKINYKSAAEYLQTPESTVRRWYADKKFPSMAVKLMEIKFRGYLPYTKAWKMIYFDLDDNLVTPHVSLLLVT